MTVSQKLSLGRIVSLWPSHPETPRPRPRLHGGKGWARIRSPYRRRDKTPLVREIGSSPRLHATVVPIEGQHLPSLNLRSFSLFCCLSALLTASASGS